MNDSDPRDEIVRLEAQIDELAARIENCRKFILAGRVAVAGGGVVLIAMLVGAVPWPHPTCSPVSAVVTPANKVVSPACFAALPTAPTGNTH